MRQHHLTQNSDSENAHLTQTQTHSDSCSARPRESHRFARMPSVVDREGGGMQILHDDDEDGGVVLMTNVASNVLAARDRMARQAAG